MTHRDIVYFFLLRTVLLSEYIDNLFTYCSVDCIGGEWFPGWLLGDTGWNIFVQASWALVHLSE